MGSFSQLSSNLQSESFIHMENRGVEILVYQSGGLKPLRPPKSQSDTYIPDAHTQISTILTSLDQGIIFSPFRACLGVSMWSEFTLF